MFDIKHLENKIQMLFYYAKICFNLPMHVQSREEEVGWEQKFSIKKGEQDYERHKNKKGIIGNHGKVEQTEQEK